MSESVCHLPGNYRKIKRRLDGNELEPTWRYPMLVYPVFFHPLVLTPGVPWHPVSLHLLVLILLTVNIPCPPIQKILQLIDFFTINKQEIANKPSGVSPSCPVQALSIRREPGSAFGKARARAYRGKLKQTQRTHTQRKAGLQTGTYTQRKVGQSPASHLLTLECDFLVPLDG